MDTITILHNMSLNLQMLFFIFLSLYLFNKISTREKKEKYLKYSIIFIIIFRVLVIIIYEILKYKQSHH